MEKEKRKYATRGDPPCPTPTHIDLPTGRRIMVADIMGKSSDIVTINLRTGLKISSGTNFNTKYSIEDRKWISKATLHEIREKYDLTLKQSSNLRTHSIRMLQALNIC